MSRLIGFATTLLLGSTAAMADDRCDIHYRVTPNYESAPRRLDVELSFAAEGRRESWLRMSSNWAGIKDYGATLTLAPQQQEGVRIESADNAGRWRVEHGSESRVSLRYQIRAALDEPEDGRVQAQDQLYRTQIGADWFQFFGYGVLPSVEAWDDRRSGRMCLNVVQPKDKTGPLLGSYLDGRVQPGADIELQGTHAMLRHAFYAGGPGWRVVERSLAGGPVITASRGRQALDDVSFAEHVGRLLDAHRRFWGDTSSPRQTVVRTPNYSTGSNGGTLVHQAAVLHVGQDFGPNNESFEFLIGHENLHQWLPGRLGGQSDGNDEQAARHYWLSEGFTDYYTHRLLLAAGLWTLDSYASQVTRALQAYWRSPARNATAASIAPRFFSDYDAGRQMYARGELLAMTWDRQLRRTTPAGLDRVMRSLLLSAEQAAKAEPAYERVLTALTSELGPAPREQVRQHIGEGRSFEMDDGLAGPCFAVGWTDVPRWMLGFDPTSLTSGAYKAKGVIAGGPAYQAGLRDGMGLRGWSIYNGDIAKEIVLKVESEGGQKELRYLPVDGSTERLPVLAVRPGAPNDAVCQAWIRR